MAENNIDYRLRENSGPFFGFNLSKEFLDQRVNSWNKLFTKYSVNTTNAPELNLETLELVTKEKENYESEVRLPMRNSISSVQYWVNTGKPPCLSFIDENYNSPIETSISESEVSACLPAGLSPFGYNFPQAPQPSIIPSELTKPTLATIASTLVSTRDCTLSLNVASKNMSLTTPEQLSSTQNIENNIFAENADSYVDVCGSDSLSIILKRNLGKESLDSQLTSEIYSSQNSGAIRVPTGSLKIEDVIPSLKGIRDSPEIFSEIFDCNKSEELIDYTECTETIQRCTENTMQPNKRKLFIRQTSPVELIDPIKRCSRTLTSLDDHPALEKFDLFDHSLKSFFTKKPHFARKYPGNNKKKTAFSKAGTPKLVDEEKKNSPEKSVEKLNGFLLSDKNGTNNYPESVKKNINLFFNENDDIANTFYTNRIARGFNESNISFCDENSNLKSAEIDKKKEKERETINENSKVLDDTNLKRAKLVSTQNSTEKKRRTMSVQNVQISPVNRREIEKPSEGRILSNDLKEEHRIPSKYAKSGFKKKNSDFESDDLESKESENEDNVLGKPQAKKIKFPSKKKPTQKKPGKKKEESSELNETGTSLSGEIEEGSEIRRKLLEKYAIKNCWVVLTRLNLLFICEEMKNCFEFCKLLDSTDDLCKSSNEEFKKYTVCYFKPFSQLVFFTNKELIKKVCNKSSGDELIDNSVSISKTPLGCDKNSDLNNKVDVNEENDKIDIKNTSKSSSKESTGFESLDSENIFVASADKKAESSSKPVKPDLSPGKSEFISIKPSKRNFILSEDEDDTTDSFQISKKVEASKSFGGNNEAKKKENEAEEKLIKETNGNKPQSIPCDDFDKSKYTIRKPVKKNSSIKMSNNLSAMRLTQTGASDNCVLNNSTVNKENLTATLRKSCSFNTQNPSQVSKLVIVSSEDSSDSDVEEKILSERKSTIPVSKKKGENSKPKLIKSRITSKEIKGLQKKDKESKKEATNSRKEETNSKNEAEDLKTFPNNIKITKVNSSENFKSVKRFSTFGKRIFNLKSDCEESEDDLLNEQPAKKLRSPKKLTIISRKIEIPSKSSSTNIFTDSDDKEENLTNLIPISKSNKGIQKSSDDSNETKVKNNFQSTPLDEFGISELEPKTISTNECFSSKSKLVIVSSEDSGDSDFEEKVSSKRKSTKRLSK